MMVIHSLLQIESGLKGGLVVQVLSLKRIRCEEMIDNVEDVCLVKKIGRSDHKLNGWYMQCVHEL